MANINETPLNKPLLNGSSISRPWELFFSQLGDGLNGKWEYSQRKLTRVNIADEADVELLSYHGREATFSFVWENGATFNNSKIELNRLSDYSLTEGYLQVWDGATQVEGAYCKDFDITLPDLDTTNKIIIQGTILTKINRR